MRAYIKSIKNLHPGCDYEILIVNNNSQELETKRFLGELINNDENKRNLPWRLTKDPYKIWISEVMLQQTSVSTVENYFIKFK